MPVFEAGDDLFLRFDSHLLFFDLLIKKSPVLSSCDAGVPKEIKYMSIVIEILSVDDFCLFVISYFTSICKP
jgi:hypothetical protein